ncbi:MAG: DUF2147 domain-containing protein [Bacteroidota bacterium]
MRTLKFSLVIILFGMSLSSIAQTPIGTWKTVDDKTGETRSHVKIYEEDGKLYGKIIKVLVGDPDAVCDECSGSKKNSPILGLIMIEDMKKEDDRWVDGEILDPETGSEYNCELWLEDGNLKVRGSHWSGFFRTQTWYPV